MSPVYPEWGHRAGSRAHVVMGGNGHACDALYPSSGEVTTREGFWGVCADSTLLWSAAGQRYQASGGTHCQVCPALGAGHREPPEETSTCCQERPERP